MMIETVDLTKEYGERQAVDELSLRAEEGDIFGFLGPNGAGKTTTIRMLTGLLAPTGGKAMVAGVDDAARHPQAVKRIVGVLPESQGYYGWMTGREYLEYFGSLYGISRAHSRAGKLLAAVGLAERARTPVGGYSRSMRQRLGTARAMVHPTRVLFLDEPSLGLDPRGQREILGDLEAPEVRGVQKRLLPKPFEVRVELRRAKERSRHKRNVILDCIRQPGFVV